MDLSRKLFDHKQLSMEDLIYLRKLLETNLSLNFCMHLLEGKRNHYAFEQIRHELEKGMMIEEVIGDYLPASIKEYMLPLLKHFSFLESLSLSLDFYERNNGSVSSLISEVAYPSMLMFVTITALYLFDLYGIDSIFSLLKNFGSDIGIYYDLRIMFRVIIRAFYYGLLILILIFVYFLNPKRISYLYLVLSKYFPSSLINIYYCEEFVSLLLICIKRGYGSKKSLEILKKMKNKPVISMLAFHLDASLLEGEQLKDAVKQNYYDNSLSRFIRIASYSNDFGGVLTSYTKLARERIDRKMKSTSKTIQFFTYLMIGLIIVFIYQILFMPMQVISTY